MQGYFSIRGGDVRRLRSWPIGKLCFTPLVSLDELNLCFMKRAS